MESGKSQKKEEQLEQELMKAEQKLQGDFGDDVLKAKEPVHDMDEEEDEEEEADLEKIRQVADYAQGIRYILPLKYLCISLATRPLSMTTFCCNSYLKAHLCNSQQYVSLILFLPL